MVYLVHQEGEVRTMTKWYVVKRGFITMEQTFDTEEEAELFAIAVSAVNGETWWAELVIGYEK